MFFMILLIMGGILLYGAINSVVELIPFMIYLLFYLGVIVFGCFLYYKDVESIKDRCKLEKYVTAGTYLIISLFFPRYIFRILGILMNDAYIARFIGIITTFFLLFAFYLIRRNSNHVLMRKIITGLFLLCISGFFLMFSNFGYKTYSQQASERAGEIEEYTVEKNTPLLVEISVEGNQKSTLFGDFFVTKDKFKYYYMGMPITHQFVFKKMPANSKLRITGRDLYEKDHYIEVYCKENGCAGYIKEEKLVCIVDYMYVTNKDTIIYGTHEREVNVIPAEGGEGGKSKELFVNNNHIIEIISEGTEVLLGDGPNLPFGYESIRTLNGTQGYIKKDDLDIIPVPKKS